MNRPKLNLLLLGINLISNSDRIQGARSGIQCAIKRQNLDLTKTCLDLLWDNSVHRNWLKWRTATIVIEEAPYLAGEFTKISDSKEKKDWYKFFYSLTVAPKAKDHIALLNFPQERIDLLAETDNEMDAYSDFVLGEPIKNIHNDYIGSALKTISKRSTLGGKPYDISLCSPAYFLVAYRGVTEDEVKDAINQGATQWKETHNRKPKTIDLPWYVFDQHTQAGMFALNVYLKNHSENLPFKAEFFKSLWFWAESAYTHQLQAPSEPTPKIYEHKYYDTLLSDKIGVSGMDVEQFMIWWTHDVQDQLTGIVEWCLGKRCQE